MTQIYRNAICLPCLGAEQKPLLANGAHGGVFTQDKQPIKEAFLVRRYRLKSKIIDGVWDSTTGHETVETQMVLEGNIGKTKARLSGRHIFAGYLFPHYGHFLLESLSRLWVIRQNPDIPLVWLGVHNQHDFIQMQQEIFELFGLRNPMHLITEQTEVEELVVPEAGYIINSKFTDAQAEALRLVGPTELTPGKKVWLSRSKLKSAIIHNEPALEDILAANGWILYHPEEHSIAEQLAMLADAELIAGVEGSAFHTLILMPDFAGEVVIFGRGAKLNMDYANIGHTHGHKLSFASPPRTQWSTGLNVWENNWLWTDLDFILDTLKAERPKRPWAPLPHALRNIAKSLANYFGRKSITELWPTDNAIATDVGVQDSTVVAEKLTFDVAPLREDNTQYYEMTTDQYFTTQLVKPSQDIYCFRHQADYGAALRAFNSSRSYATKETIWLIEGWEAGAPDSANERLLATIQAAYPTLSVARVQGASVAVVWGQSRPGFTPEGNDEQSSAKPSFIANLPVLHINDIAKGIARNVAPKA
ncbi:glycosyltransferase family 61 protein [Kordiimonas marina]|uniref:glycosyltransferase family 61 protein n=1 Tax=Kordiimonas marina TaxID=2872312 RepID=UPI001FF10CFC|nr:glycosyltransferase family 61 protein [Kordiimonas marina]MCJ9428950.1 glycosyltransferase family 61 protein [Kordiimonas marina]